MEVTNGWKTVVGFSLGRTEQRLQPFCQKLCGWIQCPSDDFHCERSLTLVVSVFGRKTSLDTENHSFIWRPQHNMLSGPAFPQCSRGVPHLEQLFQERKCLYEVKGMVKLSALKSSWREKALDASSFSKYPGCKRRWGAS